MDASRGTAVVGAVDMTSKEMLATPQYYMLVAMFIGSALAGLMVIYCIRLFGIDALQASGVAKDAEVAGKIAGTAMACDFQWTRENRLGNRFR